MAMLNNQMVYVFYTSINSMYKFGPTMDAPHPCPMPQVLARMNGAVEKWRQQPGGPGGPGTMAGWIGFTWRFFHPGSPWWSEVTMMFFLMFFYVWNVEADISKHQWTRSVKAPRWKPKRSQKACNNGVSIHVEDQILHRRSDFYQLIVLPSGVMKHGWPMKQRIFNCHVWFSGFLGSFGPGLATFTFRQFPRPRWRRWWGSGPKSLSSPWRCLGAAGSRWMYRGIIPLVGGLEQRWLMVVFKGYKPTTMGIWCLYIWLVVWNMAFMTFHSVGNGKSSQLTNSIIFQRGRYTTNQPNIALFDFISGLWIIIIWPDFRCGLHPMP